jgi:flavin reductase (DIM6/NTAB) family NADH-FMN oxidoreductase RutF
MWTNGNYQVSLSDLPSMSSLVIFDKAVADDRTTKVPHVAESAFSMECEVMHWYDIKTDKGDPANTVIIGRVKMMHVVRLPFHQHFDV